jgi:hypothetical protein
MAGHHDPRYLVAVVICRLQVFQQPVELILLYVPLFIESEVGFCVVQDVVDQPKIEGVVKVGTLVVLVYGHVEASYVVREIIVSLVVSRADHIWHIGRNWFDLVEKCVANFSFFVVQVIGNVA